MSNMVGNDATEGRRDANWAEICGIGFIFVKVEQVYVGEVGLYTRVNLTIVDMLEEEWDSFVDIHLIAIDESYEDIQ